MAHPHNSRLALRDFLKFAHEMGLILHGSYINDLLEKIICLVLMDHLEPRMLHPASHPESAVRIILQFSYCALRYQLPLKSTTPSFLPNPRRLLKFVSPPPFQTIPPL